VFYFIIAFSPFSVSVAANIVINDNDN